jgi:hypothetical protein
MEAASVQLWTCARCIRAQRHLSRQLNVRSVANRPTARSLTTTHARSDEKRSKDEGSLSSQTKEQGAMSRRLEGMVEEAMETGSRSDRRTMQSASNNFSEELKAQLEARIAESSFGVAHQKAITEANLPSYAGKGTTSTARAAHWTGDEATEDAALRMLDDAHKKLRAPRSARVPPPVSLRPAPKIKISQGSRLANARDKTSIYATANHEGMSEEEREKLRKELKERFTPGARPMPVTLQGLSALANERIEDAIARGQFKNIKRGKNVNTERDHNANSPFLDTTEYFMNKIIQKQEIVPPWIEKQQELVKLVDAFRKRLRSDWRRHAARMIASEGGPLEQQVTRARGYALAEEMVNPRLTEKQKVTGISSDGTLVNISVEDRIAAGIHAEKPEVEVKVEPANPEDKITQDLRALEVELEQEMQTVANISAELSTPEPAPIPQSSPARILPTSHVFRDPAWESTERAYHTLAIEEINSLTRSYNLMAPKIAQRPYTNLERELKRCFAIVAPQLADEIVERARRPTVKGFGDRVESRGRSVLDRVTGEGRWQGHEGTIREEDETKGYGFKQFWKDIWRNSGGKSKHAA